MSMSAIRKLPSYNKIVIPLIIEKVSPNTINFSNENIGIVMPARNNITDEKNKAFSFITMYSISDVKKPLPLGSW